MPERVLQCSRVACVGAVPLEHSSSTSCRSSELCQCTYHSKAPAMFVWHPKFEVYSWAALLLLVVGRVLVGRGDPSDPCCQLVRAYRLSRPVVDTLWWVVD